MAFPSIRTVAVTAGFLGLTMIIAGTATAMVGAQDGGAVGSGIRLLRVEEPAATPAPAPSRDAEETPATPIEVGADPLLTCDTDGSCSPADESASPGAAGAATASTKPGGAGSDETTPTSTGAAAPAAADAVPHDHPPGKRANEAPDTHADTGRTPDQSARGERALPEHGPRERTGPERGKAPDHARAGRH